MHLNLAGKAENKKTFAIISRYLGGTFHHAQTPYIMEYEEETDIR